MLSPFLICLTLITGTLAQDNQKKPETAEPPAGTVRVTGRVVYEDTEQPATRHRVQLILSSGLLNARNGLRIPTAITDERGEFALRAVTAGEYYVHSEPIDQRGRSKLEPVLSPSGNDEADAANLEQFKKNSVKLTVDGQRNVEVNLRVPNPHFGSISGTVFDAKQQPAPRATVHVITKGNDVMGMTLRADDQGRYKVRGLVKGEYIVGAVPPPKEGTDGERLRNYQGTAGATYFPSTSLVRNSPPVAVLPDVDTANVDITLLSKALRSLTGTVRMRGDSRPVTNAILRLHVTQITDPASDTSKAATDNPMFNYTSSTDKNGRWSFSNVPDGAYRLYVEPKQSEPLTPRFVQTEQDLKLNGNDLDDLLIEVSEGGRLSGSVVFEGTQPLHVFVHASSYRPHANSSATVDDNGKFVLTGAPSGEIEVSAVAYPQEKYYVKLLEANGLDLLRNKITLAEKDEIKDVRIVISANIGVITGRVSAGGKPVAGANVMLRRTGDDKLRLLGGNLSTATNERGVFTLSAAPGSYLVVAWRTADGPAAYETAMNKAEREQGTGLILSPGARKEIDIRLP
ncbi:MAG TPA: carboxypeptidase-like regulatory domain-containing protein [Pyrinomonadaceae bacterium]